MTQHSDVHKFGNGETHENVPNTAYSDKAMKGKMINPNDPQENLDLFSGDNDTPPVKALPFRTNVEPEIQNGQGVIRPEHERQSSSEDGYLRQQTVTASHHDPACSRNTTNQQLSDGVSSGGPEPGIEHSPLHIHYQAKAGGRERSAVSSPSWERKPSSNNGVDRYTAGRSTARGDESPEKAAAVPKFGEWDANDPSSVDGFTHIFNKVRQEKHLKHDGIATTSTTSGNDNSENTINQTQELDRKSSSEDEDDDVEGNPSDEFTYCGNMIYSDSVWREGDVKDLSYPRSPDKQEIVGTKKRRWLSWWWRKKHGSPTHKEKAKNTINKF